MFGVLLWHMGTGGLLMIPAGVVAVGVSWHRACILCPLAGRGGATGLAVRAGEFFKCVCRDMRRMPEAGVRLARCAGNASLCGYAGIGGCDGVCVRVYGKGGGTCGVPSLSRFGCGGVLLSHTLPGAVPSPCQVLASGFGMGPGVSPGPWPPQIFNCHPTGHHARGGSCGGSGTG